MIDYKRRPLDKIRILGPMQLFYLGVVAALILTVLSVLLIPGVDDFVEMTFQRYLGRAAR